MKKDLNQTSKDNAQKYISCIGLPSQNAEEKAAESYILPLQSITQSITIINALADVHIEQTFVNNTQRFLEVVYEFPVNPKACFYKFVGTFGNKKLEGIVKEKQLAKKQYTEAVKQGKKAGYGQVNKQSKDILKVQFGNISPNQELKVQIKYVEQLSLTLNTFYKFDLSTKLNPRYSNSPSVPNYIGNINNKTNAVKNLCDYNLNISVTALRKISMARSLTHELNLLSQNKQNNQLKFTIKKGSLLNKDFTFIYSTEDFHLPSYTIGKSNQVTTAMISFIPKYCSLNLQDSEMAAIKNQPLQVDIDTVKGEYIFLLDRSGSMGGKNIQNAKKALILFIKSLPVDSYFNVISFGSTFQLLFKKSCKNQLSSIKQATGQIMDFSADMGGTEIENPLRNIFSQKVIQGYPKQVFLLTDGEVTNTAKVINLVKTNIKYTRVHAIGIGNGASRALIQGCAQKGKGHYIFIKDNEDSTGKIIQLLNNSLSPVISKVSLNYDKTIVQNIVPNPNSIPYILKNEIAHFYLTFKGQLKNKTTISFLYTDSFNKKEFKASLDIYPVSLSECFVAKMGQFRSLVALQDAEAEGKQIQQNMYFVKNVNIKQQIISLSIKHQILSKFTSFLFVQKQLQDGQYQQVLAKGQLNVAVGSNAGQEGNHFVNQSYMQFNNSESDEEYIDECALDEQYVNQCCILQPSSLKAQKFSQNEDKYSLQVKPLNKKSKSQEKLSDIQYIVSQQQIQGFWTNLNIVKLLFHETIYKLVQKYREKQAAATFLITKWIEKYHNIPSLSLILRKANSWLKKQKDYKTIQLNFAGYFK